MGGTMSAKSTASDLEFASLVSSKICHDVIGPVGAIFNGLEVLAEGGDEKSKAYALETIRDYTELAKAKLQFARFAFGAAGSAGSAIDLTNAKGLAIDYVGGVKHKLVWSVPAGYMPKDRVKLLLNIIAIAINALPRGGEITASLIGTLEQPKFVVKCVGQAARAPQHLVEFMHGQNEPALDAMTIQAYYICRLAEACGMRLNVSMAGADVLISAE